MREIVFLNVKNGMKFLSKRLLLNKFFIAFIFFILKKFEKPKL